MKMLMIPILSLTLIGCSPGSPTNQNQSDGFFSKFIGGNESSESEESSIVTFSAPENLTVVRTTFGRYSDPVIFQVYEKTKDRIILTCFSRNAYTDSMIDCNWSDYPKDAGVK